MRMQVKVTPGATRNEVVGPYGDGLKVRVTAAPEKGKANAAVIRLLAEHFSVAPARIAIVAGASSSRKTVDIRETAPKKLVEARSGKSR